MKESNLRTPSALVVGVCQTKLVERDNTNQEHVERIGIIIKYLNVIRSKLIYKEGRYRIDVLKLNNIYSNSAIIINSCNSAISKLPNDSEQMSVLSAFDFLKIIAGFDDIFLVLIRGEQRSKILKIVKNIIKKLYSRPR